MKRFAALLLAALVSVGCSAPAGPPHGTDPDTPPPQAEEPAGDGALERAFLLLEQTYVVREQALAAALQGTANVDVQAATFVERYKWEHPLEGGKEQPVWVVELIGKHDQRPAGTVVVDAVTGRVISGSNPPSGQ